jgi:hypothetical protein
MSKKISFKRPDKPISEAADDWVNSAAETASVKADPEKAREAKPKTPVKRIKSVSKKKPSTPSPKTKSAAEPRPARTQMSARVLTSELKWVERMLASVDRQMDFVAQRIVQTGLSSLDGDPPSDPMYQQLIGRTEQLVDRMKQVHHQVRGGRRVIDADPG